MQTFLNSLDVLNFILFNFFEYLARHGTGCVGLLKGGMGLTKLEGTD